MPRDAETGREPGPRVAPALTRQGRVAAGTGEERKGMKFQDDLVTLFKARNTLITVLSREEVRAERQIMTAGAAANYPLFTWDCVKGICDANGRVINGVADPTGALAYVRDTKERRLYVFRDLHRWFDPVVIRSLRSLQRELQVAKPAEARVVVLLSPTMDVPLELSSATVIDMPLPDREEMGQLLDDIMEAVPDSVSGMNGTRELAIDSAIGLSAEEASNCYAKSLVSKKAIDPGIVVAEKKRVIAREKVVEWYDPDPRGLDAVGGLDVLKAWLDVRRKGFSAKAREFGLPAPKGVLLVGVPGCGKSLTAKCVATAWGMPLLRLDMGGLKSKYVGESEQNLRKALQVAETVAPCVLWLDEIEKAMAGAIGAQGDGGVSSDALGTILSWLQEKSGSVFVVATANQVESLPPELLRKGRFDELFFVDLPTATERGAILKATLSQFERGGEGLDARAIVDATDGFAGAEIAALVPEAMFAAFNDGERDIATGDMLAAAGNVVPLSKTAGDKIESLRTWAKGRARFASSPDAEAGSEGRRVLDI